MSNYAILAHTAANAANAGALTSAGADNTFGLSTLNAKFTDSATIVTLASSAWTHSATGIYQIQAVVGFGIAGGMGSAQARAGLYNLGTTAFAAYEGGSDEIIGSSGVLTSSGTSTGYVELFGRYTVSSTAHQYAIYMAGDASTGTWYSTAIAQGAPALGVTSGTKPEIYKLVQITQE